VIAATLSPFKPNAVIRFAALSRAD
jgi:hypothetical protein